MRPIGVPEFDPVKVAALFVDEGVSGANNPASITGRGFLDPVDPKPACRRSSPLARAERVAGDRWRRWGGKRLRHRHPLRRNHGQPINLNNTANHSVVILASRDPNVNLNARQRLAAGVCNQNPVQTNCYGGGGLNDGLSFIHVYCGSRVAVLNPPTIHDATLSGGCPTDDSRPYYNLDGVDANGNGCIGDAHCARRLRHRSRRPDPRPLSRSALSSTSQGEAAMS